MGSFREKNREGIHEIREKSKETTDVGTKWVEDANRIKRILDSIHLEDEEDVQAIEETGHSYQNSFDSAFSERIEPAALEIEKQGDQIKETSESELRKVRSGISKLEQAGGISEIGHDAAETGRSKLEESANEYEGIVSDTKSVVDEARQKTENIRKNLGRIFG